MRARETEISARGLMARLGLYFIFAAVCRYEFIDLLQICLMKKTEALILEHQRSTHAAFHSSSTGNLNCFNLSLTLWPGAFFCIA